MNSSDHVRNMQWLDNGLGDEIVTSDSDDDGESETEGDQFPCTSTSRQYVDLCLGTGALLSRPPPRHMWHL